MDRYRRSLRLAKASLAVLRADKELVVFPLVSFVALLVVLAGFAVPFLLVGFRQSTLTPAGYVLGFLFYVVSYSVSFFFNAGLVGAALMRLDGGDPTVRDGLRIAGSRLPAIVGYAVLAATVGMLLRAIGERAGIIGQIVLSIVGFVWSIATFLVVPVLVVENVGPIDAVKRSGSLLRKTWGEQLLGGAGIGLIFGLLTFGVMFIAIFLVVAALAVSAALAVVVVVAAILAVFAIALVGSALAGIYTASVYRYATTGDAGAFGTEAMDAAFRQRAGGVKGLFGGAK